MVAQTNPVSSKKDFQNLPPLELVDGDFQNLTIEDKREILYAACRNDDLEIFKQLQEKEYLTLFEEETIETAFAIALDRDSAEVFFYLQSLYSKYPGCSIDSFFKKAYETSISNNIIGRFFSSEYLFQISSDALKEALIYAAQKEFLFLLELFLTSENSHRTEINQWLGEALCEAAAHNAAESVEMFLKQPIEQRTLEAAFRKGCSGNQRGVVVQQDLFNLLLKGSTTGTPRINELEGFIRRIPTCLSDFPSYQNENLHNALQAISEFNKVPKLKKTLRFSV